MVFPDDFIKLALEQSGRERALSTVDVARPFVQKGLAGGLTGLWSGLNINKLRAAAEGAGPQRKLPLALAAVGALLGLGDEQLRRMARQRKYQSVLKETRRQV
jgi:hypothetical protein